MEVLAVGGHVRGKLADSLGKEGHLHLGRPGIALAGLVGGDYLGLLRFVQILPLHFYYKRNLRKIIAQVEGEVNFEA